MAYDFHENSRRSHDIILQIIKPQLGTTGSTGTTDFRGGLEKNLFQLHIVESGL